MLEHKNHMAHFHICKKTKIHTNSHPEFNTVFGWCVLGLMLAMQFLL